MNLASWTDILTQYPWVLLAVTCLFAALESIAVIGLFMPGTVMMAMVASLAGTIQLSVPLVITFASLGAILGDGLSYWLGKSQSSKIPNLWPLSKHPDWLERGQTFFSKHGALSVLLGRFVGPVRPLVPMIAGMMAMPGRRFTIVNIISAVGWALLYVLPGYYLGQAWKESYKLSQGTVMWLIEFTFIALLAILTFSWLRSIFARGGAGYRGILKWMKQHPCSRRWWRRMQKISNHRHPPVGPFVLFFISIAVFIIWTLIVEAHKQHPLPIDIRSHKLFSELAAYHWPHLYGAIMDKIADRWGMAALMLPWLIWWLYKRYYALFVHWISAVVLLFIFNSGIKHLVARARPSDTTWLEHSWSYPSAHTSISVLVFGLAASCVADRIPIRYRNWPYWAATFLCMLVALSRLAFGVHWASDLIGGALLGIIMCAGVRVSYPFFTRQRVSWAHWRILLLLSIFVCAFRVIFLPVH